MLPLVKDNQNQVTQVKALQQVVDKRLAFLKRGIELYQQEGLASVQNYIQQVNEDDLSGSITNAIGKVENTENRLLQARTNQSIASANRTYITILIETFCNILLIFIIYYLAKRELDYRSSMEKQKDEFISIATHELKTPITSLQVFAQILQKKVHKEGDAEVKQYAKRIEKQVSRLTELINDLLDVSRLQLGKMKFEKKNFNLNHTVREVVEALRQTTEKHEIIVKGKIKKQVYGDEDRVSQVVANLLSNAIKYSPNGKKILISLKNDIRFATVSVQDFGIGISDEHKAHIFERFYRAYGESEKSFPGLGMGLFISEEIVRRHRGKLDFISQEGKGSTFFFSIPYAKNKERPASRV